MTCPSEEVSDSTSGTSPLTVRCFCHFAHFHPEVEAKPIFHLEDNIFACPLLEALHRDFHAVVSRLQIRRLIGAQLVRRSFADLIGFLVGNRDLGAHQHSSR